MTASIEIIIPNLGAGTAPAVPILTENAALRRGNRQTGTLPEPRAGMSGVRLMADIPGFETSPILVRMAGCTEDCMAKRPGECDVALERIPGDKARMASVAKPGRSSKSLHKIES